MKSISKTQKEWKKAVAAVLGPPEKIFSSSEKKKILKKTVQHMIRSPSAKILYDWACENNVEIWLDDQLGDQGSSGYIFPGTNTVILNAATDEDLLPVVLAHELFHIWQDHQNLFAHTIGPIKDFFTANHLLEGSAYAFQAVVISELSSLGHTEACEILLNSKIYDKLFSALENKDLDKNQIALEVFMNYPKTEAFEIYAKNYLNNVYVALLRNQGHRADQTYSLGTLNNRIDYKMDETRPLVKPRCNAKLLEKYGTLPNGQRFLKHPDFKPQHIAAYFSEKVLPISQEEMKSLNTERRKCAGHAGKLIRHAFY